jgi:hypothetical protein
MNCIIEVYRTVKITLLLPILITIYSHLLEIYKMVSELSKHIENSIKNALDSSSSISPEYNSIKGFSTSTQRHLMNNLCSLSTPTTYLEVGLYGGATFFSSACGNTNCTIHGVENFSQDFGDPTIKAHFEANLDKYKTSKMTVHNDDFFAMDLNKVPSDINVYYYDGHHDYEYQKKALPFIFDKLASTFIWVIDDYDWDTVKNGSTDGLAELSTRVKIDHKWEMSDNKPDGPTWHNGVAVLLLTKI